MRKRDISFNRMLGSVSETLSEHETDVNKIVALAKGRDQLDVIIEEVGKRLLDTVGPSGASGPRVVKATSLTGMITLAHEVAAGCHALGNDTGDGDLATATDYSVTDLSKGAEADVVARCAKILELATDEVEDLADYNITQAKLTALGKKIDAFKKASPKPRQRVAKKAAANKALPRLFLRARTLLTRTLDRLMVQFKETNPDFYAEYKTARKIVNEPVAKPDAKDEKKAA